MTIYRLLLYRTMHHSQKFSLSAVCDNSKSHADGQFNTISKSWSATECCISIWHIWLSSEKTKRQKLTKKYGEQKDAEVSGTILHFEER